MNESLKDDYRVIIISTNWVEKSDATADNSVWAYELYKNIIQTWILE